MKKIVISMSIAILNLFFYVHVFAQGIRNSEMELQKVAGKAGTTEGEIGFVIGDLINAALSLVGIIFLVLMVYAGVLWMTARGEEEKIKKARDIIVASIIGLFITVSAYAISYFVTNRFQ